MEKNLNARIVHKHDIEENWLKATNFTPKQGELIVYDVDNAHNYVRIKIGDGERLVNSLPFVDAGTLAGASLRATLNESELEIPTSKAVLSALAGKSDVSHTHDDAYDAKGSAQAVQQELTDIINNIEHPIYVSEANQDYMVAPLNADTFGGQLPGYYTEVAIAAADEAEANSKAYIDNLATLIYEKIAKAYPQNLLDNSNFAKPINQRGKTSYTSGQYCIDRWICNSNVAGTLAVENGYVKLSNNGTGITDLYQVLEDYNNMKGKRYTIVVNCNGSIYFKSFTMGSAGTGYAFGDTGVSFFSVTGQHVLLRLMNANTTANFYWAALYEGDYTEETLPNYQPKMYSAEMMECQRYYQVCSTNSVKVVDMRPTMRTTSPTITSVTGGYAYSSDL